MIRCPCERAQKQVERENQDSDCLILVQEGQKRWGMGVSLAEAREKPGRKVPRGESPRTKSIRNILILPRQESWGTAQGARIQKEKSDKN